MPRKKNGLLILKLMIVFTVAVLAACGGGGEADPTVAPGGGATSLPDPVFAPHFIDAYPAHGDTLPQAPLEIVLNFDFTLHPDTSVAVTRDGETVPLGEPAISSNQLSVRAPVQGDGVDGVYEVGYSACWPDGSCHQGSSAYSVDSATVSGYEDLRGQDAVTVSMKDGTTFEPARMIISPGTTVTWVNDDSVAHFVNTDPHPSHNVLGELNSLNIDPGGIATPTPSSSPPSGAITAAPTSTWG